MSTFSRLALLITIASLGILAYPNSEKFLPPSPPIMLEAKHLEEAVKIVADTVLSPSLESKRVITNALDGAISAYENPPKEEDVRNEAIRATLKKERIDFIFATSPAWVAVHLTHMEGSPVFGEGYESSIAWGTGVYNKEEFYWFAYVAGAEYGSLQIDIGARLHPDEIMKVRGLKPTELERPDENRSDIFEVFPSNDVYHKPEVITRLRFNEGSDVDWVREFCLQPDTNLCDTVSALQKYVLPELTKLLPELKFEMKGRFPKILPH